jgi:hypothetical protein
MFEISYCDLSYVIWPERVIDTILILRTGTRPLGHARAQMRMGMMI